MVSPMFGTVAKVLGYRSYCWYARWGKPTSPAGRWVSGSPMRGDQFLYAILGYVPLCVGKSTGTYIINTKTPHSAMKQNCPVSFSFKSVR